MSDIDIDEIRTTWLDDRIGTHFDTCHLSHYKCAIARLCDEVEMLRRFINCTHDSQARIRLDLGLLLARMTPPSTESFAAAEDYCRRRDAGPRV